ncbi:MAG: sensor domain-containing diguanylate cyclase [Sulfurospirillaceae bacterium]|nr:sensor domain-containing diguanylate cyclase [Sulfurospirillaceae bacterium]
MRKLSKLLFPKRTKVLVVQDNTTTAKEISLEIKEIEKKWQSHYAFIYLNDLSELDLQTFIDTNQDDIIVYLLAYNNKQGKFFNFEESMEKLQATVGTKIPIFGSLDFLMGKGIVGGSLISGYDQGVKASSLLQKILSGQEASTLPLLSNEDENRVVVDYKMLQKFSVKKPVDMHVTYINEPKSFWVRHKVGLMGIALVALFFMFFLFILLWRNRLKNKIIAELNSSLENSIQLALQESKKNEKLFKFIADSAHYVIWIVDMEHTLTYINEKAKEYFKHEPQQLLGTSNFEFLPEKYYEELQKYLQQLRENTSLEYVEFDIYCHSLEKHMKNYIVPIAANDGGLAGYKGIIHDITQEKIKLDTLKIEAQTDYLTGALNRNTFEQELDRLLIDYTRFSTDVCVMMLDVDYFKKINDTFGHFIGDFVLKKIAHTLKTQVRKSDFVFRYGGEEFAIVLPNITLENAIAIAQKIRQLIEDQQFKVDDKNVSVTISIGLSLFQKEDQSINKVVIRADEALYRAKRNGRNRVEVNYEGML